MPMIQKAAFIPEWFFSGKEIFYRSIFGHFFLPTQPSIFFEQFRHQRFSVYDQTRLSPPRLFVITNRSLEKLERLIAIFIFPRVSEKGSSFSECHGTPEVVSLHPRPLTGSPLPSSTLSQFFSSLHPFSVLPPLLLRRHLGV